MKTFLPFLLCFFVTTNTIAESSEELSEHKIWIMGVPQHLFQNCIRLELDIPKNNFGNWISVAPSFYYRNNKGNLFVGGRNMQSMWGVGMDVAYRWYIHQPAKGGGVYLSAGDGYRFVSQQYKGKIWRTYPENNLTYFIYDYSNWNKNTHTGNIRATAGYQSVLANHFAFDYFIGFSLKLSSITTPDDVVYIYDDYEFFDFGYTGFMLLAGIRMGIGW